MKPSHLSDPVFAHAPERLAQRGLLLAGIPLGAGRQLLGVVNPALRAWRMARPVLPMRSVTTQPSFSWASSRVLAIRFQIS